MRMRVLMLAVSLLALVLAGCAGRTVTRVDPENTPIDLSGNWNDVDSQEMAGEMVGQITNAAWVENHVTETGRKPVLIVGDIRNKTVEHIPMKTLTADLEAAFINSGRVLVVASPEEREQVRQERAEQQDHASVETMKQWGREMGADYMLLGELNSIFDRYEGNEAKYYQADVYLVNLENNLKVWVGQTKIKKAIGKGKFRG